MATPKGVKRTAKSSEPKLPFSFKRQIVPPIIGLMVMALAFVVLNSQWLVAKIIYHFNQPKVAAQTITASTANTSAVYSSPTIIIPKIDAKAPIVFESSTAEWKVQLALRGGVDHFGTTANPGQNGNMVIFGHSSGLLWAPGNYKFVFTLLDKLQPGDQIYVDYQGKRYVYKVDSSEVILPTNLSVLNQHTSKPMLSLITCTPVGTSRYRLVVHAEQISPNPNGSPVATSANVRFPSQLPH